MTKTPDQPGPGEPPSDGRGAARMQPLLAGLALAALIVVMVIVAFWGR